MIVTGYLAVWLLWTKMSGNLCTTACNNERIKKSKILKSTSLRTFKINFLTCNMFAFKMMMMYKSARSLKPARYWIYRGMSFVLVFKIEWFPRKKLSDSQLNHIQGRKYRIWLGGGGGGCCTKIRPTNYWI